MPILKDSYRTTSLTLPADFEDALLAEVEAMTEEERSVFYGAIENLDLEAVLAAHEYDRECVDVETWLFDPYFMGDITSNLYSVWRDDLIEMFGTGLYSQAVITGSTGCLAAGHLVQAANGAIRPIESMVGGEDLVALFDAHHRAVGKATGRQRTILVRFGHGFEVRCTPDHKFMTQRGWIEAKDLDPSRDRVRTPRTIRVLSDVFTVSEAEAEWVGMVTADGSLREAHGNSFHKADDAVIERFCRLSSQLGITWREEATRSKARAICCHSMSYELIDRHGLRGTRAWEKKVSPLVTRSPLPIVAAYLRGLFLDAQWALDAKTRAGKKAVYGVTLSLANEVLIKQTWLLLKRFGIRGRVFSSHSGRSNERTMWHCEIRGISNLETFNAAIGCPVDGHGERWKALIDDIATKNENSNADLLPLTWAEAGDWIKRHGVKRPRGSRYACWQSSAVGKTRRVTHLKMGEFLAEHPAMLEHAAEAHYDPEVLWESVNEVVQDGLEVETYDLVVPNGNAYLVDGVHTHNTGKSFFSHLVILRMIYEASCLKDPARSYGLASGSVIGFCTIASSKETARRVVFEGISAKMRESYYFRDVFPPKRETKDEIVFPKNLQIIAGSSTDTSIIGMNIFGGIFDEGNFVRTSSSYGSNAMVSSHVRAKNYQKAMRLYTSVIRRMKSRFNRNGKVPGILCVLSSKTTNDSFTEQIINKAIADGEKTIFVRDRSLVDVKRDQFSKETFKLLVGTESYPSRILPPDENLKQYGREALIIDVPVDLRPDFENNMEEALRDLMGVSTVAISSFMSRVDLIEKSKDTARSHPFLCPLYNQTSEWDSRLPYRIQWPQIARQRPDGEWEPLRFPDRPRFVGLDPASTGDAFGLAFGCAGDPIPMVQDSADGNQIVEMLPTVHIDFVLRIKGRRGEEVVFRNVRKLLYEFAAHGFHFARFTTDSYQSREMCQALEAQGYKAEIFSVDTTKDPYRLFRALIYDGRFSCYDYPVLYHELKSLEEGPSKIDHRADSSKDCADAVCHVVYHVLEHALGRTPNLPERGISLPAPGSFIQSSDPVVSADLADRAIEHQGQASQSDAPPVEIRKIPRSVPPSYNRRRTDGRVEDMRQVTAVFDPEELLIRG